MARQLEQVETPAAPELKEAAKQAANQAADALDRAANDEKQFPAAKQALARSQEALQDLAEAVKPQNQSAGEAAKALAQEQQAAAQAAQQEAGGQKAPTPEAATEAMDDLRDRQQELAELRGTPEPSREAGCEEGFGRSSQGSAASGTAREAAACTGCGFE